MKSSVEEKYPWADLVIALLSVNNYSLEKTFSLFDGLAEVELFDPANLAAWDLSEISRRMGRAGYDRGRAAGSARYYRQLPHTAHTRVAPHRPVHSRRIC